jgi:uncharacterized protein
LRPDSPAGAALQFFVMDVAKILVLLTTVIYLMGWLRALLTPEKVRAMMRGRSGPGARLMAVGLGAVTPFCSCSSIPLFIGFVEAGIPLGVTLSFLIASPMVNQVAVVVLAGVIGWEMTLIYVATGLTVAFVGGYVLQAFKLERWVEDYVWKIQMGEAAVQEERDNSCAPVTTMPGTKCGRSSAASGNTCSSASASAHSSTATCRPTSSPRSLATAACCR